MSFIQSFPPLLYEDSRILILGSMPGVISLEENQYYAHPRNHFWRILYSLLDESLEHDYDARKRFLREKGIGLWDVLHSCVREGSLDTSIRNESVNDLRSILGTHPNIRAVFFNGAKAAETFRKKVGFTFDNIAFIQLPSTSPAYTIPYEEKLEKWKVIKEYLC
ncbi:DNA-deoxyinosine glycosylase [Desulfuribacillus stibiiarsenatis]|nr:DNA-deoxyinosine glycosylase [Desulfuribacillus stibiiarsenatis]